MDDAVLTPQVSLALLAKALGATPRHGEGRGFSVRTGLLARARSRGFASPSASVEADGDASLSVQFLRAEDARRRCRC